MEKETTGLYLSGHPMDAYREAAKRLGAVHIGAILGDFAQEGGPTRFADEQRVCLAGVVTSSKTKTTRNNSLMAYVTLDDGTGSMELLCFSRVLETSGSFLRENQAISVKGRLSVRDEKAPQLMCDQVMALRSGPAEEPPAAPKSEGGKVLPGKALYLRVPGAGSPQFAHIRLVFTMFPGLTPVKIRLADSGKLLGGSCLLHRALVDELLDTLGEENVVIK